MKHFFIIIFLIYLVGTPTIKEIEIANKYNRFWGKTDIVVDVKNTISNQCQNANPFKKNIIGCTWSTGYIEVIHSKHFETTLVHELLHYNRPYSNEKEIRKSTTNIMNWMKIIN